MNTRIFRTIIFLTLLPILYIGIFGCTEKKHDPILEKLLTTVSDHPKQTLYTLDSIDPKSLSETDRHLYDFLTVKARDKDFIYHTSDSLILDVVDYYASHEKGLYPEALYYAARVYSDLGDSPTAFHYYRQALDALPPDTKDLDLKGRIISQTGRLLNQLRLFDEAASYITESINLSMELNDTIGTVQDLQLLGNTYLRAKEYDKAQDCLTEALRLGANLQPKHAAKSRLYLAQVNYETGNMDSALSLIRDTPYTVDSLVRNTALAYAANIYLKSDILDTAYLYARKIIVSPDPSQKNVAYQVILSPKLRNFLSEDSLNVHIAAYRGLLENFYDQNKNLLAVSQVAYYNYQIHERDKRKAEKSKRVLSYWLMGAAAIILIGGFLMLYLQYRNKVVIIQFQQIIESIRQFKDRQSDTKFLPAPLPDSYTTAAIDIDVLPAPVATVPNPTPPVPDAPDPPSPEASADSEFDPTVSLMGKPTKEDFRKKLIKELIELVDGEAAPAVDPNILNSSAYLSLQELISRKLALLDKDPLWDDLEKVILDSSPEFKKRLNLLTQGKLTAIEYRVALLIKCGVRPSQMTVLLNKSNGAIISRRDSLGKKIFDQKMSSKQVSNTILWL